jgi:hypothetical protein
MHCTNCGIAIEKGTSFCTHCGTAVSAETANSSASNEQPMPPPPPPASAPAAAVTAAAANFVVAMKKGASDLGGAKSADDVILIVKQNRPLMVVGAAMAVLLLVLIFTVWANSGSPPSCDDSDVQKTVHQILQEQGVGSTTTEGMTEVSYDSKSETRSCKLMASHGSDARRLNYTVEWGNKEAKTFLVRFQND